MSNTETVDATEGLAVIGLWGRFPGAENVDEFWRNLRDGIESISVFSDDELRAAGVDPSHLDSNHVRAKGVLANVELFDAAFFGINPREAEIIDPQHRVFLEGAWAALENAGYNPEKYEGSIGVYAGPNINSYFLFNLFSNLDVLRQYGFFETTIRSRPDLLTTQVSYKLNLRGPSMSIQTACSTSLVAVHVACQGLLSGECDMALAGGVSISLPQTSGYIYQEGGILSPDGHCRAFDAMAQGTVFGNGAGIVVLKRLADALADGDTIHAIIKGSAVNNDGSLKVGLTAPGLDGQAAVITEAQLVAGVEPETISYVETHGTATALGDPIEVAALSRAFRSRTDKNSFCAIGSLKSNVGHLDTAAGVASLIKTVLALSHRQIPPSLHFEQPNPQIDFLNSPFFVNAELRDWEAALTPRRAGVSSFGIGGTNAHLIVEESPVVVHATETTTRPLQLLLLSARSPAALDAATAALGTHLSAHPEQPIADVAYTLQVGRKSFSHRRMLVCTSREEAQAALGEHDPQRMRTGQSSGRRRAVSFLFPGQGTQYVGMGRELYESEEVYRVEFDRCSEYLKSEMGIELRDVLYGSDTSDGSNGNGAEASRAALLKRTEVTQPALFVVEYAMAQMWRAWGVEPESMLGHSVGEYVAACVAGVMTVEEALRLVAARGRLMAAQAGGLMLGVGMGEEAVVGRLEAGGEGLWLAAVNGEKSCVVSGEEGAVTRWERELTSEGIMNRRLETSHAFHSGMMEGMLGAFEEEVGKVRLKEPKVAYVSNVTGKWITAGEATDPHYWLCHLRHTVRFADGLGELLKEEHAVLLEVGPGNTLSRLARRHSEIKSTHDIVSTLPDATQQSSEAATVLSALGRLWLAGVEMDWAGYYGSEQRRRLPLPTYPFERQRFWIEAQPPPGERSGRQTSAHRKMEIADWFYVPSWKQSALPSATAVDGHSSQPSKWLVFGDGSEVDTLLAERLKQQGHSVVVVLPAGNFGKRGTGVYQLDPSRPEDYVLLFEDLERDGHTPDRIAHLWSLAAAEPYTSRIEFFEQVQERGFYSLLLLAQALGKQSLKRPLQIYVVSNDVQDVTGGEPLCPEKATILGPCKVITKEYPNISCCHVDVVRPARGNAAEGRLIDQLMAEFDAKPAQAQVAFRGHHRWLQTFEQLRLESQPQGAPALLRGGGVYLITGGLGTIGLTLAGQLAQATRCKLILLGRSTFPARDEWAGWLTTHTAQDGTSLKIGKLSALEEMGTEVLLVRADVAREPEMREALAQAEKHFGKVNGVIHAAGVAGGGMMQLKTVEAVAEVFAPKVHGTLVLEAILKNTKLDFFICCSSALSVVGPLGQVDYCAANAFLDAYAHDNAARHGALTISINWDAWGEAGMAVESAAAAGSARPEQAFAVGESIDHPLFDTRAVEPAGGDAYVTQLAVGEHWMLDEHRIMGRPVVPGTAYLEMARAAFRQYESSEAVELRDVVFLSPLTVGEDEKKEVRTIIEKNGSGWNFRIVSKSVAGDGSSAPSWREHVTGKLFAATVEPPKKFDIDAAVRACNLKQVDLPAENLRDGHSGQMAFGPRWNSLKQLSVGANELLGLLELPAEFAADLEKLELHPALMDVATGLAARRIEEGFYLPLSYGRVRVRAPLPGKIFAHLKPSAANRAGGETIAFDVALLDEHGITCVEIEDFILRRVDGASARARAIAASNAAHESAQQRDFAVEAGASTDSSGVVQTRDEIKSISGGISLKEGAEAFRRILSGGGLPQVIVTPRDLQTLIEKADALTQASLLEKLETQDAPKHQHPRPALQTLFVAPTNEIEERLADIWQKLLGIEQVGIHDNFFELGGHSLLTLQVMSRLRDAFQVELPMRDVFELPTIAELARAVEANIMNKIIEKISGLSDEEAQLTLQESPTS